jgi:hypothetical protein
MRYAKHYKISIFVRHCEERSDEAIQKMFVSQSMDCFASLAMTLMSKNYRRISIKGK